MSNFNPNEHLMKLKGKDYLEVKWRLVWFRMEHPTWNIDTILVDHDAQNKTALFCCKISDDSGRQVSSGYGSESVKDFGDYIEKAETKSIGRALAMLGYGTQFAPEMEEGERIVDSPVERKKAAQKPPVAAPAPAPESLPIVCEDCGKPVGGYTAANGTIVTAERAKAVSMKHYGRCLCTDCMKKVSDAG